MIRKLIKLSTSTNVVSLPNKWIKKNRLVKGAEINLEEIDNRIIISSRTINTQKNITLDITDVIEEEMIWLLFDSAYTSGYDIITVHIRTKRHGELLSKFVRYFPGLIIFEETKDKVIFKDIASNPTEDISKIVSRVFNINIDLLNDAIIFLKAKDYESLTTIKKRDYAINSYVSYCFRQLNKYGFEPSSKTGVFHTYLKSLEMFSDKLCDLLIYIGNNKLNINSQFVNLILEEYKQLQKMHFSFSQKELITFDNKRIQLRKDFEKSKTKDEKLHQLLLQIARSFYELEELESELNM